MGDLGRVTAAAIYFPIDYRASDFNLSGDCFHTTCRASLVENRNAIDYHTPLQRQTMEWAKDQYNKQYDAWVPWLEDIYLRYFTRDNKASYTTRGQPFPPRPPSPFLIPLPFVQSNHPNPPGDALENLNKTKVTNIEQVSNLQDGVHDLVAGQVGQGGLAQPVGDLASREGMNRVERKGKDDKGGYLPGADSAGPGQAVAGAGNAVVGSVVAGGQQAKGAVEGGVKSAGGLFGFGKGKE